MKRLALLLIAVITLAGCGAATADKPPPAPAAAPATPTTDMTRQACHQLSLVPEDDIDARFDPDTWLATAQAARNATDPDVTAAGERLLDVVVANTQIADEDRRGQPNIDLSQATLDLAEACGNLYGDGPW